MQKVGCLSQLKSGHVLSAVVAGEPVAVFMVDGQPVATTAVCPHAGGPLSEGSLCNATLSCPWHGWSFDLRTGQCEEDPDLALPLYSVHLEGDDVFVSL